MENQGRCASNSVSVRRQRLLTLLLGTGIGIHLICIVILASVPPVSRDALNHHLAVPKQYLLNGGIYEIPSMHYAYFPMNLDLLYVLPIYFNFDIAAKYIHFGFALLTAGLIYHYLKAQLGRSYGLLGAFFFLTIPIIVKLSVTVYVDLGLIFFSWACLYFFLQWYERRFQRRHLILSALACGLALGTKYNGLILLPIMGAMISIGYASKQNSALRPSDRRARYKNALKGVQAGAGFILIALIIFSPWMIRNIIWKQNPVYPLYENIFKAPSTDKRPTIENETSSPHNAFWTRRHVYKETLLQTVLIPVRAFFQGRDNTPKYFDGKLNPFLILLPLLTLAGVKGKEQRDLKDQTIVLSLFAILYILFVLFETDFRIRYMAPAIPPLVVLSVFGVKNLVQVAAKQQGYAKKFGWAGIALLLGLAFIYNSNYIYRQFQIIQPAAYLSGKVDRNAYIRHFRREHAVMQYANATLPKDARVLCLSIGDRTYYLDRAAHLAEDFYTRENGFFSKDNLLKKMKRYGTTHIIFNKVVFLNWARSLSAADRAVFKAVLETHTDLLYEKNGVLLLKLHRSGSAT